MRKLSADVVVIGGGSTGAGVARDTAMRGYSTILIDRNDLAQGTSGRFHGLLHSGGRYVVSDPESATECAEESAIVARINADAVERTGGMFVCTPGDDPAFADRFLAGASAQRVPAQEISVADALRREPRLNPGITRAIEVADGSIDGWRLIWGLARSAQAYGATVLTYHEVTSIKVVDEHITGVTCLDRVNNEVVEIDTNFVLNAAGPWGGRVAAMAGFHDVDVVPGRGIMVGINHRLVNTVVNRCVYPADGDIIVPVHTICVIGTTDVKVDDPDRLGIPREEVDAMIASGEQLIPGFSQSRILHVWSGARPLIRDARVAATDTRHMSRGMSIVDHKSRDGIGGMLTIAGGKLTTYRLMAQNIVDTMEDQLGESRPCRTAEEPVPEATSARNYTVSHRLAAREAERPTGPTNAGDLTKQIVCECELVTRAMLNQQIKQQPDGQFDDWRRQLRLGMGPCQGTYCGLRVAGQSAETDLHDAPESTAFLRLFLRHRWIGLKPGLQGAQAKQAALNAAILVGTLNLGHMPEAGVPTQFTTLSATPQEAVVQA